jgi:hypothetical protein
MDVTPPTPTPTGGRSAAHQMVLQMFYAKSPLVYSRNWQHQFISEPFGWNYKPAEKYCWLIFCERKILFRLKKQAE